MSGEQWLRQCSLVVANNAGDALDLSALRIKFQINQKDTETPNSAAITVYGLADETADRIRKEFTRITLQAGYPGIFGTIFDGNIVQSKKGRENGVDTYLEIRGGDGDTAYTYSVVNATLSAGSTQADQVSTAAATMSQHGVTSGYINAGNDAPLPRGKVMFGMSRDYLRQSAKATGSSWSVQNGSLQFFELSGVLPDQAIVLNSASGLVGTPEQTDKGVQFKCLLNPMLRVGGKVKINQEDISLQKLDSLKKDEKGDAPKPKKEPVALAADGFYRVIKLEYTGDTRGQDWYVDGICLDIDATVPPSESVQDE